MVERSLSMREVPGSTPGFSSDMLFHRRLILLIPVHERAQSHGLKFVHMQVRDSSKVTLCLFVRFGSFRDMKK